MSLATFISTVEADITAAFTTLEDDAATALVAIWNVAKPVFTAFEPTIVSEVLSGIAAFLQTADQAVASGDFADIEQAFLEDLETSGSALLGSAQQLGSALLQALIGLVKAA